MGGKIQKIYINFFLQEDRSEKVLINLIDLGHVAVINKQLKLGYNDKNPDYIQKLFDSIQQRLRQGILNKKQITKLKKEGKIRRELLNPEKYTLNRLTRISQFRNRVYVSYMPIFEAGGEEC